MGDQTGSATFICRDATGSQRVIVGSPIMEARRPAGLRHRRRAVFSFQRGVSGVQRSLPFGQAAAKLNAQRFGGIRHEHRRSDHVFRR